MVHFEQVRLAVPIKHDVEAEDLEAEGVFEVVWLARSERVAEAGQPRSQRLDDKVLDGCP